MSEEVDVVEDDSPEDSDVSEVAHETTDNDDTPEGEVSEEASE